MLKGGAISEGIAAILADFANYPISRFNLTLQAFLHVDNFYIREKKEINGVLLNLQTKTSK